MAYIDPAAVGRWEGKVFVLHEPLTINGKTFKTIDLTHAFLADDITGDDVVHAMLNPLARDEQM